MYSPKIDESLIPALYRLARAQRTTMTRLVSHLIRRGLKGETLPEDVIEVLATENRNVLQ